MENSAANNPTKDHVVEIEFLLRRVSGMIKKKGREILNHFPITPPQFEALQWLNEYGDMTIGELSGKMFLAFSTMTDLVDRMEKTDLVERKKDEKDRRVVQIHLLPKGKRIIEDVIDARQTYLLELLRDSGANEAEAIKNTLRLLYNRIGRRTEG
jgi:DNA-binding MarR family transcriptional regulator